MRPKFSVIIPAYNRDHTLCRALCSLLQQTYKNFEVIIADDGSIYDTEAIIAPFLGDLDITLLLLPHSGQPNIARAAAINHSNGDWIAFLDSDDTWCPRKLEQVAFTLTSDDDVLYHRLRIIRGSSMSKLKFVPKTVGSQIRTSPLFHLACIDNPLPTSGVVVKSSWLKNTSYLCLHSKYEDYATWINLAVGGAMFRFIPLTLGDYYLSSDSISRCSPHRQSFALRRIFYDNKKFYGSFIHAAKSRYLYSKSILLLKCEGCTYRALSLLVSANSLFKFRSRFKRVLLLIILHLYSAHPPRILLKYI